MNKADPSKVLNSNLTKYRSSIASILFPESLLNLAQIPPYDYCALWHGQTSIDKRDFTKYHNTAISLCPPALKLTCHIRHHGCTGNYQNDKFQGSQWRNFVQKWFFLFHYERYISSRRCSVGCHDDGKDDQTNRGQNKEKSIKCGRQSSPLATLHSTHFGRNDLPIKVMSYTLVIHTTDGGNCIDGCVIGDIHTQQTW